MQLSEKDKQALQEKYKAQRQAMWSGKQSTPQESEEKTQEGDHGNAVDNTTDSTGVEPSETQSSAVTSRYRSIFIGRNRRGRNNSK